MSPSNIGDYLQVWTDWPILQLVLRALLVAAVALVLDRVWSNGVRAAWRLGVDPGRRLSYSVPLLRITLLVLVPFGVLNALRMENPMAAVTIAIVTIGTTALLALDHLRDMTGGVALVVTQPFRVGDTIRVGEVRGRVQEIALTRTVIQAWHGQHVRVPNRRLADRALEVARGGAALPAAVEVRLPEALDTALALSALRDQAYLSVYTDTSAPVVVEVLGDRRARIHVTPIRPEEASALASDLIARAESRLS